MIQDYKEITLNKDGTFGPTANGKKYKPIPYHNNTARNKQGKNKWVLKQNEQYVVFKISAESEWYCFPNRGLFSILEDGKRVFGQNDERLAYFVEPNNIIDPWHGYPVFSSEFEISEELLDKWEEDKIISQKTRIRIGKGKL